jgi:hypothetical protein
LSTITERRWHRVAASILVVLLTVVNGLNGG